MTPGKGQPLQSWKEIIANVALTEKYTWHYVELAEFTFYHTRNLGRRAGKGKFRSTASVMCATSCYFPGGGWVTSIYTGTGCSIVWGAFFSSRK